MENIILKEIEIYTGPTKAKKTMSSIKNCIDINALSILSKKEIKEVMYDVFAHPIIKTRDFLIKYKLTYSLPELKNLKTLDLSGKRITDISLIGNLVNLEKLNLSNNKIKDVTPLLHLRRLVILNLRGNPIKGLFTQLKGARISTIIY